MSSIRDDITAFLGQKHLQVEEARQRVALQIVCGLDLSGLDRAGADRVQAMAKLRRALERERLKGLRRHWSYDLNRHIALAQVLHRLRGKPRAAFTDSRPATSRPLS